MTSSLVASEYEVEEKEPVEKIVMLHLAKFVDISKRKFRFDEMLLALKDATAKNPNCAIGIDGMGETMGWLGITCGDSESANEFRQTISGLIRWQGL